MTGEMFDIIYPARLSDSELSHLGDLAEATGIDGPVLGRDGYGVPAIVRRGTAMRAGPSAPGSERHAPAATPWPATGVFLGQELLLDLDLFSLFLQLGVLVDLFEGLGPLISSSRDPVILKEKPKVKQTAGRSGDLLPHQVEKRLHMTSLENKGIIEIRQ